MFELISIVIDSVFTVLSFLMMALIGGGIAVLMGHVIRKCMSGIGEELKKIPNIGEDIGVGTLAFNVFWYVVAICWFFFFFAVSTSAWAYFFANVIGIEYVNPDYDYNLWLSLILYSIIVLGVSRNEKLGLFLAITFPIILPLTQLLGM